jgi:hypothetical protein
VLRTRCVDPQFSIAKENCPPSVFRVGLNLRASFEQPDEGARRARRRDRVLVLTTPRRSHGRAVAVLPREAAGDLRVRPLGEHSAAPGVRGAPPRLGSVSPRLGEAAAQWGTAALRLGRAALRLGRAPLCLRRAAERIRRDTLPAPTAALNTRRDALVYSRGGCANTQSVSSKSHSSRARSQSSLTHWHRRCANERRRSPYS